MEENCCVDENKKVDIVEMLIAKNVIYIAFSFVLVSMMTAFGVDFTVSMLLVSGLVIINNYAHCKRHWVDLFTD